jgi:hypothetical protein
MDQQSYRLAKAIAAQKGVSMGKFIAEAVQAYCGVEQPTESTFVRTKDGILTLRIGRPITPEEVTELIDE